MCVRACVRACVLRACVCVCVWSGERLSEKGKQGVARLWVCVCARVWMQGRENDRVRYM